MNGKWVLAAVVGCTLGFVAEQAQATPLMTGDILATDFGNDGVVDPPNGAIFLIDPTTGDRTIVSGRGVGAGPELFSPTGVISDRTGAIYVTDNFFDSATGAYVSRILRIDATTGNRTIVSGHGVGSGPSFRDPAGGESNPLLGRLTQLDDFRLAVAEQGLAGAAIYEINLTTGDRSIISGLGVGSGTALNGGTYSVLVGANDILLDPQDNSKLIVGSNRALLSLDRSTGDWQEVVGNLGEFEPPLLVTGRFDATREGAELFVAAEDIGYYTYNRAGGTLTATALTGDLLQPDILPFDLALSPSESLLYATYDNTVFEIDRTSNVRRVLSGQGIGTGPLSDELLYLHAVSVPEPGTNVLLLLGALVLGALLITVVENTNLARKAFACSAGVRYPRREPPYSELRAEGRTDNVGGT